MPRKICKKCDNILDSEKDFRKKRAICFACEKIIIHENYIKNKEKIQEKRKNKPTKYKLLVEENKKLRQEIENLKKQVNDNQNVNVEIK